MPIFWPDLLDRVLATAMVQYLNFLVGPLSADDLTGKAERTSSGCGGVLYTHISGFCQWCHCSCLM